MPRRDGITVADEWFDDFIRRTRWGTKRDRVLSDAVPRTTDRHLAREREYDAHTERLRRTIRNQQRQERRHA